MTEDATKAESRPSGVDALKGVSQTIRAKAPKPSRRGQRPATDQLIAASKTAYKSANSQDKDEPLKRLNVDIPKSQHLNLKVELLRRDTSLRQFLVDAVREKAIRDELISEDEWPAD